MKTNRLLTLTLLCATTAFATDRIWDGGGSDANWNTADNWGGTALVAGDALFFGGTSRLNNTNTLSEGTAFAGITFNSGAGAFMLGGNGITLDGDLRNLSSVAQTLNLPVALSEIQTVYSVNSAIAMNNVISGTGGLWVSVTNAILTLSGNNTYEGVTTVSNGQLSVTHSSALGSTNGNTVVYCQKSGYLSISGGIDLAEPITLSGQRASYGYSLMSVSGSNTISGPLTRMNEIRLNANGGSTLAITGGIIPLGSGDMVINAGGTIAFYKTPINLAGNTFWTDSGGLTIIGVAGNSWNGTLTAAGTLRTDITNALPENTTLTVGVGYSPSGTLNLNGNNQTIAQLISGTTNSGTRTVTSPIPASLTVNQSAASSTYNGLFSGAVSLVKNGTGILVITNGTSTTTGELIVNTGTVVIAQNTTFSALASARINGGTLELRSQSTLADTCDLYIADTAKLKIEAGLSETVNGLFLNGVQQLSGTWGTSASGATHSDDVHFVGAGIINVLSSPAVTPINAIWDGEGSDTLTSTENNWDGDTLPAFDNTTYAIFGTGGITATVDTAINLYGLAFNRDSNFTVANGIGSIMLGYGGIAANLPAATSRTYTLAEDTTFTENQVWSITNNGAGIATVMVTGSLSDSASIYSLTKHGNGVLVLSGNNNYDGLTTVKTGGVVRITHANALGSTNGITVVENGGWVEMSGGISVAESFTLSGDFSTGHQGSLRSTGGSNVVSGLIQMSGSRIKSSSGSLDLTGGATGGQLVLGADGTSFIRVSNKPILIGGSTFYAHTASLIILAVSNNVWGQLEVSGNYLRTDVDNALAPTGILTLGSSSPSGVNLNGTRQTVGRLVCTQTTAAIRTVDSPEPATLTVNQSADTTFNGAIAGAVNLVKINSGSLLLSNTNTTHGTFCVSNGTLIVSSTGTLGGNSTNIIVGGTGTLTLSNSVAIADSAVVTMPEAGISTAKINLAAGVNERVGWLYYGDQMQRAGTYGAAGSGASYIDTTHFSGNGLLRVLHDNSGTMLIVR